MQSNAAKASHEAHAAAAALGQHLWPRSRETTLGHARWVDSQRPPAGLATAWEQNFHSREFWPFLDAIARASADTQPPCLSPRPSLCHHSVTRDAPLPCCCLGCSSWPCWDPRAAVGLGGRIPLAACILPEARFCTSRNAADNLWGVLVSKGTRTPPAHGGPARLLDAGTRLRRVATG